MGKGGRCVGLTTVPPSCADCLKSGSLNLLEPSGPVQACNGLALPPDKVTVQHNGINNESSIATWFQRIIELL